jgi:hypothetical protein
MTKSRFDIEYKKWLQQMDVDDDDSVWNEIQDELDFKETWDNISGKLDEIRPQRGRLVPMNYLKAFAAAAAIILIMLLPFRYFAEQVNTPPIISELGNNAGDKEQIKSVETTPLKAAEDEKELVPEIATEAPLANNSYRNSLVSFSSNELIPNTESIDSENTAFGNNEQDFLRNEEPDLNRIQSLPFDAKALLAINDAIPLIAMETASKIVSEPDKSSGLSFRVAEVGLLYGYKNTWLLNHETRNGLNPGKLGNALPTFNQDIGVSSIVEVNNRHLFGLEFLWKSEAGQDYQQYINASYVNRNINLDYLKFQAFYLWENRRVPGQAIVGGYFASLTMAEEQQAKVRFSVDNSYSNLDYGLLAGYQFDIELKNRIVFKPGVRVNYNLVNIFEGDDITPGHFKRTKNFAASFNMTLSYKFFN